MNSRLVLSILKPLLHKTAFSQTLFCKLCEYGVGYPIDIGFAFAGIWRELFGWQVEAIPQVWTHSWEGRYWYLKLIRVQCLACVTLLLNRKIVMETWQWSFLKQYDLMYGFRLFAERWRCEDSCQQKLWGDCTWWVQGHSPWGKASAYGYVIPGIITTQEITGNDQMGKEVYSQEAYFAWPHRSMPHGVDTARHWNPSTRNLQSGWEELSHCQ